MTPGTGAEHRETLKMDVPDGARHTPGVLGPCVAASQQRQMEISIFVSIHSPVILQIMLSGNWWDFKIIFLLHPQAVWQTAVQPWTPNL